MESLPSSQKLVQRLILTKFKQDVDILSVLKEMLKPNDIVVMETSVDLDLRHQLLLGSSLCECGLGNDLGCRDPLVL